MLSAIREIRQPADSHSRRVLFGSGCNRGPEIRALYRSVDCRHSPGFRQPDHSRRSVSQNSRSRKPSRGRGRWACKASNCCRNARFSRMRSAWDRNTPVSQPNRCRKSASMAAILSVWRKTTKRASLSNCGRSQFWRMTTEEDVREVLQELCEEVFVEQLASWFTDESTWPADRSFDVFCSWFDFQHHSMLVDLCDELLIDESD